LSEFFTYFYAGRTASAGTIRPVNRLMDRVCRASSGAAYRLFTNNTKLQSVTYFYSLSVYVAVVIEMKCRQAFVAGFVYVLFNLGK
jgi:hypothetical protein